MATTLPKPSFATAFDEQLEALRERARLLRAQLKSAAQDARGSFVSIANAETDNVRTGVRIDAHDVFNVAKLQARLDEVNSVYSALWMLRLNYNNEIAEASK